MAALVLCMWCHSEIREGHACVTVRPRHVEHALEIGPLDMEAMRLVSEIECDGRERLADVIAGADVPGADGDVCRRALRLRALLREQDRLGITGKAN